MPEAGIGRPDGLAHRLAVLDERLGHGPGHGLIGKPGKSPELGGHKSGPGFRHIEPPIAGQALHQDLRKAQRGRLPACRDIAHRLTKPNAVLPTYEFPSTVIPERPKALSGIQLQELDPGSPLRSGRDDDRSMGIKWRV